MSAFALACGGATVAETPSEPGLEIPTNVPKSSGATSGSKSNDLSATSTIDTCSSDYVDGYGCEGGPFVASAAEVLAVIQKLQTQSVSVAKGTALLVTADLRAEEDIELSASDLTAKDCADCTPYFRARAFPRFDAVPGVTCVEIAPEQPIVRVEPACLRVSIKKGATFRLRSVVQDMHPSAKAFWPFIDFVSACTVSCAANELYDHKTHQCFSTAYELCAYGEGLSPEYCSCRADECHQKPKGTRCYFAASPDNDRSGTCGQSGCVADR